MQRGVLFQVVTESLLLFEHLVTDQSGILRGELPSFLNVVNVDLRDTPRKNRGHSALHLFARAEGLEDEGGLVAMDRWPISTIDCAGSV